MFRFNYVHFRNEDLNFNFDADSLSDAFDRLAQHGNAFGLDLEDWQKAFDREFDRGIDGLVTTHVIRGSRVNMHYLYQFEGGLS